AQLMWRMLTRIGSSGVRIAAAALYQRLASPSNLARCYWPKRATIDAEKMRVFEETSPAKLISNRLLGATPPPNVKCVKSSPPGRYALNRSSVRSVVLDSYRTA